MLDMGCMSFNESISPISHGNCNLFAVDRPVNCKQLFHKSFTMYCTGCSVYSDIRHK